MAWFEYGTPIKRSWRKGVWLRVRNLPPTLLKQAKKFMRPLENIEWVVVSEIKPDNNVLLEFWCKNPFDHIKLPKLSGGRYNVFWIFTKEDPNWICEGDLGRGYKGD
jgi:hypothetical protein